MAGIALNIGIEGLLAAQAALETVGHNVANANTPGYSRQSLVLGAAPTIRMADRLIGTGVRAHDVVSVRDLLLDRRILTQRSAMGRLGVTTNGLSDIETLMGEPGTGSLSDRLSGFFAGISRLSSSPGDMVLRQDALRGGTDLADRFRTLQTDLGKLRSDAAARVAAQVGRINELTGEIATLNRGIASAELGGAQAHDLRDARGQKLAALAEFVDIQVTERQDGTLSVSSAGQVLVAGTARFELQSTNSATAGVSVRVRGANQDLKPTGGSLSGLLALTQNVLPARQAKLDELARTLIHAVNKAHSTGVPLTGPFRSLEGAYALQDIDGDGAFEDELLARAGLPFPIEDGALVVNVTDDVTGSIETLRIPVNGATTVGEFVAALNAAPQLSASVGNDGRLSVRASQGYGFDFSARSFPLQGALGGASVNVTGRYAGSAASDLVFRPRGAGDVGATPDLLVDVFDANGTQVATLDVGAGYVAGSELDLGNGLKVSFGLGAVTNSDSFELHAVADGDTSGVLAALGLNALFTGSTAGDIAVSGRLLDDPRQLAASNTGADGDAGALSAILSVSESASEALGGSSPIQFLGAFAADVGFDLASEELTLETEKALHDGLVAQRAAVSGVNVDEELIHMLRFQQAYQAMAQYIQVANTLNEEVLRLL